MNILNKHDFVDKANGLAPHFFLSLFTLSLNLESSFAAKVMNIVYRLRIKLLFNVSLDC